MQPNIAVTGDKRGPIIKTFTNLGAFISFLEQKFDNACKWKAVQWNYMNFIAFLDYIDIII